MKRPAPPVQQRLDVGNRADAADTANFDSSLRFISFVCAKFQGNESCNFRFWTRKLLQKFGVKSGLIQKRLKIRKKYFTEVESSRTSLASRTSSRTDFEVLGLGLEGQVLGLGLEVSSPRKLACPRLEDSTIFRKVKILWSG